MQRQTDRKKTNDSIALQKKRVIITKIKKKINNSKSFLLFHYHGLDANTINHFRAKTHQSKTVLKIYKNNLLKIALSDLELLNDANKELISGPVACLFSEKNPFSAFAIANELKSVLHKSFILVFSVFENKVLEVKTANNFIDYTDITDIYKKLLWIIKFPQQKFTTILALIVRTI